MPHDRRKIRSRGAKLPKMNNSERGKYYRQKYKEYEDRLEESVASLQRQIRDLEMFRRMHDDLKHQNSMLWSSGRMVSQVFQYVLRAQDGDFTTTITSSTKVNFPAFEETSVRGARVGLIGGEAAASQRMPSDLQSLSKMDKKPSSTSQREHFSIHHPFLQFELCSFQTWGGGSDDRDAPLISLQGTLHTKYTVQTIANLFPHIVLNKELMDRLVDQQVSYPCAVLFCFQRDGNLQQHMVEADLVGGLCAVLDNLDNVNYVLNRNRTPSKDAEVRCGSQPSGPKSASAVMGSPMHLDFILS